MITEELKNPYVNLPRAIMIGIPLVAFVYLSANIAYLTVLSPQMMIESSAVAVVSICHVTLFKLFIIPFKLYLIAGYRQLYAWSVSLFDAVVCSHVYVWVCRIKHSRQQQVLFVLT